MDYISLLIYIYKLYIINCKYNFKQLAALLTIFLILGFLTLFWLEAHVAIIRLINFTLLNRWPTFSETGLGVSFFQHIQFFNYGVIIL